MSCAHEVVDEEQKAFICRNDLHPVAFFMLPASPRSLFLLPLTVAGKFSRVLIRASFFPFPGRTFMTETMPFAICAIPPSSYILGEEKDNQTDPQ
jgi:hypothetical protein